MSQKQLQRIVVIENTVAGRVSVREAAGALSRSERQVKRLKREFDRTDPSWVLHGSQGRAPANRTPEQLRRRIVKLARGKYAGFNDTHLCEKLAREETIAVSRSTVRRILRAAGLRSPQKRRPAKYRSRRVRRAQEGMLLLIDGSCHAWLEGRGPELTLLGLVDDATGNVPAAHFQIEHENSAGYLRLLRGVVEVVQVCHAPDGCIRVYLDDRLLLQQAADPWAGPVRALDMQRSTAPRKKKPLRVYTFAGRPAVRT